MNILLFTHGIDIDGMGSAVLAGLFAQNLEVQFCETEDIDTKFEEVVLKKNKINWDYIFIADTCPSIDILKRIDHDLTLKEKVFVFDHHKNQIAQGKNKFSFVTLQFENEKGLCCGTSLFYQFLIENKLLIPYSSLDLFVEYTRQYDTWEWWDKYHNEIPHELTILYDCIGNDDYISEMKEMLLQQKDAFVLSDFCEKMIYYEKKKIERICQEKINSIIPISINGISCGIIFSEQYINEFRGYYEKNNPDGCLNVLMIIDFRKEKIFYRGVHKFVTTEFVLSQGGSGNPYSGSRNLTKKEIEKIVGLFVEK